jgi:hypothetical protein
MNEEKKMKAGLYSNQINPNQAIGLGWFERLERVV